MSWFRETVHWDALSKDQRIELSLAYQRVFSARDPDAALVLQHMLSELHHFRESENEEDVVLQNYAKRLLRNIGLWRRPNAGYILDAYLGARTDLEDL